ncbi:MAG: hypothetical protein K6T83_20450 [Alicyclobacillus sp.]|nr:hypothetical protein [Alicyclobacillus sp.]
MSLAINRYKRCSSCQQYKPLTEFGRNQSAPDGLAHMCKLCRSRQVPEKPGEVYMIHDPGTTRIVGQQWEYLWTTAQLADAVRWWKQGVSLPEMAERFGRPSIEVFIALADLEWEGMIKPRKGAVWGWKQGC